MRSILKKCRYFEFPQLLSVMLGSLIASAPAYPANAIFSLERTDRGLITKINNTQVFPDKKLQTLLKQADEVFFIDGSAANTSGVNYLWLVVKMPSRPDNREAGQCGSGTEDYFYLIQANRNQLRTLGKTLARGCMALVEIADGADLSDKLAHSFVRGDAIEFSQSMFDATSDKQRVRHIRLEPTKSGIKETVFPDKRAE
jgi:hypothetical protein